MNRKDVKLVVRLGLSDRWFAEECNGCRASCQSACKTSCTVGNQVCEDNRPSFSNSQPPRA